MKKIGFFGVTANPPHKGHLRVVEKALSQISEIWISPVYQHPFGKNMLDYSLRLEMLHLLFQNFSQVRILEIDKEYYEKFQKMPYSYELLQYISTNYHVAPRLIIGSDNYQPVIWNKFHHHQEIEKEFGLIVIADEGIHSTTIRNLYQNNKDISSYCGKNIANYLKQYKIVFEV